MKELEGLRGGFTARVEAMLKSLEADGVHMRITAGLRMPLEQARLWRQSRGAEEIRSAVAHLKACGAPFLAEVLEQAPAGNGPAVTRSLPGLSWHQWGEAVDCVWLVEGKPEWSTSRIAGGVNGYHAYAEAARQAGLTAGGLWPRFPDWPHVQQRPHPSPLAAGLSLKRIDEVMKQRFGG